VARSEVSLDLTIESRRNVEQDLLLTAGAAMRSTAPILFAVKLPRNVDGTDHERYCHFRNS
jgi:hypothetical protein